MGKDEIRLGDYTVTSFLLWSKLLPIQAVYNNQVHEGRPKIKEGRPTPNSENTRCGQSRIQNLRTTYGSSESAECGDWFALRLLKKTQTCPLSGKSRAHELDEMHRERFGEE